MSMRTHKHTTSGSPTYGILEDQQSGLGFDSSNQPVLYDASGTVILQGGTASAEFLAIKGADASLGITGDDPASATAAGGAIVLTGGIGGATSGTGGAVTTAGGAGTGVTTTGGAVSSTGGIGGTGTSTNAGGVGGAATLQSGDGGAKTGTAAAAGGAAGTASVIGGAGGATANSSTSAGGAGGAVALTGGVGGAATAGTGNGGAGGSIILTPGAGGATTGGTAGVAGGNFLRSSGGLHFRQQATVVTKADGNQSVTGAQMINGICVFTITTGRTLTTPTGANLTAACPAALATGDSFEFTVITVGTGSDDIATLTAGDGNVTFVGQVTVGPDIGATEGLNNFGTWRFVYSGTNAWVGYRIG